MANAETNVESLKEKLKQLTSAPPEAAPKSEAAPASDPGDREFHETYLEKVKAGVVAPTADAPDDVKIDFAKKADAERQARWEEHLKLQKEETEKYLASK